MHSQDDPLDRGEARGVYSGVRLDSALMAGDAKGAKQPHRYLVLGYSCADFPFSIVADTVCLPVDLLHQPHENPPKISGAITNNSAIHASAETAGISNH